jgi:hypothetical protein
VILYLSTLRRHIGGEEVELHSFVASVSGQLHARERTPVPTEFVAWWAPDPVWTFWRKQKKNPYDTQNAPNYPVLSNLMFFTVVCTDVVVFWVTTP